MTNEELAKGNFSILESKRKRKELSPAELVSLAQLLDASELDEGTKKRKREQLKNVMVEKIKEINKSGVENEDDKKLKSLFKIYQYPKVYENTLSTRPEVIENIIAGNTHQSKAEEKVEQPTPMTKVEVVDEALEARKEELKHGNYNILENKKKRNALSSTDLLLMDEMISNDESLSPRARRTVEDRLRSLIELKVQNTLKGETAPDDDFEKLVKQKGRPEQRDHYEKKKDSLQPNTPEPIPFVLNENNSDGVVIPEPTPIITNNNEDVEVKPVVDEKKEEPKKQGWFKRTWNKIKENKFVKKTILAGAIALSVFGATKMANSSQNNETVNDNKAKVENVATHDVSQENKVDGKTITFEEAARSSAENAVVKQEAQNAVSSISHKKMVSMLTELNRINREKNPNVEQLDVKETTEKIEKNWGDKAVETLREVLTKPYIYGFKTSREGAKYLTDHNTLEKKHSIDRSAVMASVITSQRQ